MLLLTKQEVGCTHEFLEAPKLGVEVSSQQYKSYINPLLSSSLIFIPRKSILKFQTKE